VETLETRTFWEERLADDWTETGVGYRALGRPFNSWMYRMRREVFGAVVARLPTALRHADVLDVGSGTGFYVQIWRELGARSVTGSDLTQAAVDQLRTRFPATTFHRLDISKPLPSRTDPGTSGATRDADPGLRPAGFDVVSCMDVLFHITDDDGHRTAIRNLAALTRPGGWCLFSENFLRRPEQRGPRQVNRRFERITAEVIDAGFEIVDRVPMFVLMNAQVDAGPVRRRGWAAAMRAATVLPATGWLAGAVLYPLERRLVRRVGKGPSTELMICRRRA
jgi:2-polyprenyl-3-methyl-5-hydroxy-6-metoxy-1,4-benzoquinol methylase